MIARDKHLGETIIDNVRRAFGEFDKTDIKLHPNAFFVSLYDCPSPSRKVPYNNMPLFLIL